MKVTEYKRGYGLVRGLRPPFICPWASEGCKVVSMDQREHQEHIRKIHEIPGWKERQIHGHENPFNREPAARPKRAYRRRLVHLG